MPLCAALAGSDEARPDVPVKPDAVRLAVAASVRHVDTDYDERLMAGVDRETARHQVFEAVEGVLNGWRGASG